MKTERTKIQFEWNGKPLTLEFTADSLRKMESRGFDVSEIDKHLLTIGETLFCGAFIAHHDDIEESTRKELFKEISAFADDNENDKIEEVLAKMFQEAIEELQSHRGNLRWRMTR